VISVLLAESDSSLRLLVAELLRFSSYQVIVVMDGRAALEHLQSCTFLPALILSDLLMEPMSGHELLDAVRSKGAWSDIPFLLMATPTQLAALHIELKHDVDGYLAKPFTLKELLGTIQHTLTTRRPNTQAQPFRDDDTQHHLA
jgi:CheY-like chemotaxis protein